MKITQGKFIFRFRQLRRQMLFTRSLMISATDQYWSSGRKTCINHSYNLTPWDQSSANDAAVVHPIWLILLMQAFPNDVINGLQCRLYILLNHIVGQDLSIIKLGAVLRSFLALVWHLRTWSPWKTQPFTVHTHPGIPNHPKTSIFWLRTPFLEYTTTRWYHNIKNTFDHISSLDGKMSQLFCSP